jgi:hypothetical protein
MQEGQEPTRFTMPAGLPELMIELEQHWPKMQDALRASGVPLNDETDEEREAREAKEAEETAAAAKKPWGDDKDFDPEKAWKLIQNVRSDVDKLKTERDTLATKIKEYEDATKSDTQKLEERATTAETGLSTAQRETARLRIALKKNLTETQAKRLVGDTEEELEADADELLASFKDDENEDGDGGGERRTPKPRMRTGAAPSSEPEETDPEKLAELVPRR